MLCQVTFFSLIWAAVEASELGKWSGIGRWVERAWFCKEFILKRNTVTDPFTLGKYFLNTLALQRLLGSLDKSGGA